MFTGVVPHALAQGKNWENRRLKRSHIGLYHIRCMGVLWTWQLLGLALERFLEGVGPGVNLRILSGPLRGPRGPPGPRRSEAMKPLLQATAFSASKVIRMSKVVTWSTHLWKAVCVARIAIYWMHLCVLKHVICAWACWGSRIIENDHAGTSEIEGRR